MRSTLTLFAAVCATSLALSTSAGAATILQFGQTASTDTVSATVSGGTTTLSTHGPAASPTSIPITITQLGTLSGTSISAFETFLPSLTSSAAVAGGMQAGFNGTIIISSAPGGAGVNVLTAVVTNGQLSASGDTGSFRSTPASTVTLTSDDPNVRTAMGGAGPLPGSVSLSLLSVNPIQSGAGFTSFTAQNTGLFGTAAVVPEPASLLSASTAVLAGLGCFGWSRRKSSKA